MSAPNAASISTPTATTSTGHGADDRGAAPASKPRPRGRPAKSCLPSGIATHGWLDWTFDTYPTDEFTAKPVEQMRTWLDDLKEQWLNVLIHGPVGTGKTGLAWCVMHAYLAEHWYEDVDFVNVRDLLAAARRSYSDPDAMDPLHGLPQSRSCSYSTTSELSGRPSGDWTSSPRSSRSE